VDEQAQLELDPLLDRQPVQASLFAQSTNKDITSMNNVQGQAARKAHRPNIAGLAKKSN